MKQGLNFKRFFASLLLLAVSTLSWAYDFQVDGIYYNRNSDGMSVTVTYKTSSDRDYSGSVVIPATVTYAYVEYRVTSIGNWAFENCSGLMSITIPNSVTSIGNSAFEGCSDLSSVIIPNSVTSIGDYAFRGCSGLRSVTIPDGVTSIGNYAFCYCSDLTSITIPNSVTSIGDYAFDGCSGLTSVTIGKSVTSIGEWAFYDCSGLTSVTIPESVTSIGYAAFHECSGLRSVTINSNAILSKTTDSKNMKSIFGEQVKEYIIGNSVTSIGERVFYDCSGLTSITILDGVTSIDYEAFYLCSSLTSVTIPESVTSIGYAAFHECSGLTSVTINSNALLSKDYTLDDNIGGIFGSQVKEYVIGDNVMSIGNYAFFGCSGLRSVTIPNSVTSIGYSAFYGCSGLTSITIPNSVRSIDNYAFDGCSGLTSITIPNSVTSIGNSAFSDCSGLRYITCLSATAPNIGDKTFYNVDKTIPVHVLTTSVALYKAADYWREFTNILGDVAPGHIYIDLTNQFPTDWEGWDGATGYTPTQFAPSVTTNDGRTVQVCEKFNGSVAETGTVFSRTQSGLINGTYCIELYGTAASTKSRDTGIDTDMTEDDEGDETAVYLYATTTSGTVKQYIPVHWATSFSEVATAVLNEVVVTDGTVEIGMFSDKKFTNWEVIQIKGVTALVDAEELHANTLTRAQSALDDAAYVNVTGEERTALQQAIADNTTVTEQTAAAYQAAIAALDGATKTFTEAKVGYDGLVAAKTLVEDRNYPYATETKKSAAEGAATAVATSAADAVGKTEALLTAYRQYAESSALMEGIEGAVDVTATYIRNPKAEEAIDDNVWQTVRGEGSGGNIGILDGEPWTDGSGSTTHKYFDGGNWGASAWDVTFKQDITLPAGRYQLTAVGRSSQDVTLTLFAGENTAEMAHINADGGLFNRGWEQTSLEFELMQDATVSIGVQGVTNLIHNWMSFSDFRLVQFPASMTAIGEVKTEAEPDAADNAPIYDLMGRRLQKKPVSGYYVQGGKTYFAK